MTRNRASSSRLAGHADEDVRHSAARALTPYVDDPDVVAGFERALAEDSCDCLRSVLEPALAGK